MKGRLVLPGFSIEHEGVERRLVYRPEVDEYIDTFGYEMVHDNDINGLLPIIAGGRNGIEEIKYDLQSMISLRSYLDSSISKKRLLELFKEVISIIQSTGMYLLDSSMLVFSLDSIFVRSNPLSINMVYLPVVRPDIERNITELLRSLFRSVLMSARFIVEQDNTYITEILNALNSEQEFSIQDFKALIDRLDIGVRRCYTGEAKHSDNVYPGVRLIDTGSDEVFNGSMQPIRGTGSGYAEDTVVQNDNIIQRFSKIIRGMFRKKNSPTDMSVIYGMDNDINKDDINNNSIKKSCRRGSNAGCGKTDGFEHNYDIRSVPMYEVDDTPVFVGEGMVDDYNASGDTVMLSRSPKDEGIPYIVRSSTGENIGLDKHIFRIGKEERYADYLIRDNAAVSRVHAEFSIKTDGYYIIDQDSLNHTYVNDKILESHVPESLKSGDVIKFADEEFVFYC